MGDCRGPSCRYILVEEIIQKYQPNATTPQEFNARDLTLMARPIRRKHGERGFSLPLIGVCVVVMVGMLGLAFDTGRMFILKNELQTFADASALAAVSQLDGSQTGVQGANTTATNGPLGTTKPNGYNFDSTAISTVTATYATSFAGTYDSYATASSPSTNSYNFIKVVASANLPLSFLPALPGIASALTLSASATAGQQQASSVTSGGLEPFMPDAHNAADTKNFGFTPGVEYTLKWGNGNSTTCAGDQGWSDPASNKSPSAHGFVDLGQGHGNSSLRGVIVFGGYPNANSTPSSVYAGMDLGSVPGNRGASIFSALAERSNQDTDQSSTTYAQYLSSATGNGRRIITVAVADPSTWAGGGANAHATVVGFGNFLLDPGSTISGNSGPICGTYVGPADMNGNGSGGSDGTKIYYNVLFQ
jgi:Flp pilus assembly protein TadG